MTQDQLTTKEETLNLLRRIADGIDKLLEIGDATHEASATTAEGMTKFAQSFASSPQPAAANSQPAGEYKDFISEAIVMTYSDKGEAAYKIVGYPYSKYGVRTWPEVLPLLGIDPDQLKPGPNPYSANVRALMGERGPKKIVGLANPITSTNPQPAAPPMPADDEPPF